MYASSSAETCLLSRGEEYVFSQTTIHAAEKNPVVRNAYRQPNRTTMKPTIKGIIVGPMLVPELKMPVANERSRLGNHSAVVFTAAGKLPASPSPSRNRTMPNPITAPETIPMSLTQPASPSTGTWPSPRETSRAANESLLVIAGTVIKKWLIAAKLQMIAAAA